MVTFSTRKFLGSETDYQLVVPNGTVLDLSGNSFTGVSLCSGCDWPFRSAKTQAPTIVNSPGAFCNNTIVPGEVAVTSSGVGRASCTIGESRWIMVGEWRAQPNMGMTMRYATMSEYLETVRACAEEAEVWPEHHGGFEPGKWDKLQGGEAIPKPRARLAPL